MSLAQEAQHLAASCVDVAQFCDAHSVIRRQKFVAHASVREHIYDRAHVPPVRLDHLTAGLGREHITPPLHLRGRLARIGVLPRDVQDEGAPTGCHLSHARIAIACG